MKEGGSEKEQRRSEGMNEQMSQERRRRTPGRDEEDSHFGAWARGWWTRIRMLEAAPIAP